VGGTTPALRIALVVSSLGCGGAERVTTLIARELATRGHRCTIFTLDGETADFHGVPAGVERVRVASGGRSASLFAAVRNNVGGVVGLARALGRVRPDVVLAFGDTTNVKALLAAEPLRIPVVVSERVDPSTVAIGRAWSRLRRLAYPRAAAVVVQTERVRPWAERITNAARVEVIGNPVELDAPPATEPRAQEIVAVGRLVAQKGFAVLLRAFSRLTAQFPGWRLTILGEGPLRNELQSLARELGIADEVRLTGQVHDVRARLRRASVFVLSSRFEGFPNALLEAMAEGAAIVATDCPSGPREILRDCPDAILIPVDDEAALADALARMLADPERRSACGRSARASVARSTPAAVTDAWEAVLSRAAAR
jgi:glycosyltransferase involved in cell wall biosynthesis